MNKNQPKKIKKSIEAKLDVFLFTFLTHDGDFRRFGGLQFIPDVGLARIR
jgi:hypothetical protein